MLKLCGKQKRHAEWLESRGDAKNELNPEPKDEGKILAELTIYNRRAKYNDVFVISNYYYYYFQIILD